MLPCCSCTACLVFPWSICITNLAEHCVSIFKQRNERNTSAGTNIGNIFTYDFVSPMFWLSVGWVGPFTRFAPCVVFCSPTHPPLYKTNTRLSFSFFLAIPPALSGWGLECPSPMLFDEKNEFSVLRNPRPDLLMSFFLCCLFFFCNDVTCFTVELVSNATIRLDIFLINNIRDAALSSHVAETFACAMVFLCVGGLGLEIKHSTA